MADGLLRLCSMTQLKRIGSLDLDEDLRAQEIEWRAGSILWIVLLATMIATGIGVFGNGWLSRTRAGEGSALSVEYDRFLRFGSTRRVTVRARAAADGSLRVTLGQGLLEAQQVIGVTPEPASATLLADGVEYRFDARSDETSSVAFDLQPVRRWMVEGEIRARDAAVRLRQFVYP